MTIELSLPNPLAEFLEQKAENEGRSLDAYIVGLLTELQYRQAKRELDKKLLAGVRSPKALMTKARWKKLEEKIFRPKKASKAK